MASNHLEIIHVETFDRVFNDNIEVCTEEFEQVIKEYYWRQTYDVKDGKLSVSILVCCRRFSPSGMQVKKVRLCHQLVLLPRQGSLSMLGSSKHSAVDKRTICVSCLHRVFSRTALRASPQPRPSRQASMLVPVPPQTQPLRYLYSLIM